MAGHNDNGGIGSSRANWMDKADSSAPSHHDIEKNDIEVRILNNLNYFITGIHLKHSVTDRLEPHAERFQIIPVVVGNKYSGQC